MHGLRCHYIQAKWNSVQIQLSARERQHWQQPHKNCAQITKHNRHSNSNVPFKLVEADGSLRWTSPLHYSGRFSCVGVGAFKFFFSTRAGWNVMPFDGLATHHVSHRPMESILSRNGFLKVVSCVRRESNSVSQWLLATPKTVDGFLLIIRSSHIHMSKTWSSSRTNKRYINLHNFLNRNPWR